MMCALSSVLLALSLNAHTVAPATRDSLRFDTTQVLITPADFEHLSVFLKAIVKERAKPELMALMTNHQVEYPMVLGSVGTGATIPPDFKPGSMIRIPNYVLIADSAPAVMQALTTAKLTGARYMQLSRTLNVATVTDQIDVTAHGGTPQVTDSSTLIGKNVVFIRTHPTAFMALVRAKLDVSSLQPQGGAMLFNLIFGTQSGTQDSTSKTITLSPTITFSPGPAPASSPSSSSAPSPAPTPMPAPAPAP